MNKCQGGGHGPGVQFGIIIELLFLLEEKNSEHKFAGFLGLIFILLAYIMRKSSCDIV